MIGVASTAPGYSLAATLGFSGVGGVGLQRRRSSGRVRPDAARRRRLLLHEPRRPGLRHDVLLGDPGPRPLRGWLGGWAIIVADIIVMANLAQIAGPLHVPALRLVGAVEHVWVTFVGVIWIVVMTAVCDDRNRAVRPLAVWPARGRDRHADRSSRSSRWSRSTRGNPPGSSHPSSSWFNPFDIA